MKIRPVRGEFIPSGTTDVMKLIVAFRFLEFSEQV